MKEKCALTLLAMTAALASNGVGVLGSAFVPDAANHRIPSSSSQFFSIQNQHQERRITSRATTTSSNRLYSSTKPRPDLPDYGKTSVEIDKPQPQQQQVDSNNKWRRHDLFGNSLIDQTVQEMNAPDSEYQATAAKYAAKGAAQITREERAVRRRALDALGIPSFHQFVADKTTTGIISSKPLRRNKQGPSVLQINIGLYCNQACSHCHVESSPLRTAEVMTATTAAQCLKLLAATPSITTLDITGGAPELNANFRYLVATARQMCDNSKRDLTIIDRCNLTVLQEPGQGDDLIAFLKEHNVRIVASLPCYSESNVDEQRGNGVFERSIAALLALNDAGYGVVGADDDGGSSSTTSDDNDDDKSGDTSTSSSSTKLTLDLVYNPAGAFLPPPQEKLQEQYKVQLHEKFGIHFNDLFTMTNMPVKRFADYLHRRHELTEYMELLVRNFNADTLDSLMCRDTVSVGWDGKVFDCDFNQQLGYGIGTTGNGDHNNDNDGDNDAIHDKGGISVFDLDNFYQLSEYAIRNDNHCFGCTAGMGSS